MKPWIFIPCAVFGALCIPRSDAETLFWGVADGKTLIDSDGDAIDDSFVFELGAFALNFDPNESNVGEWLTHWRVFDRLVFDPVFGLSTSSIIIPTDVTSESVHATDPALSFSALDAYIWVSKGDAPVLDSEWFVGRAENWTFPVVGGGCCDNVIIEWSTSDLTSSDVPKWGWQNDDDVLPGTQGPGEFSANGLAARSIIAPSSTRTPALQTHTFIPEPSSALLTFIAGFGLLLRRRRNE